MLTELLFYPECYVSVGKVATLSRFPVVVLCCLYVSRPSKVMSNQIVPAYLFWYLNIARHVY